MIRSPRSAARAAREDAPDVTEPETAEALRGVDAVWDALFPAEQTRIVRLLVDKVVVTTDGLDIRMRVNGLRGLVGELRGVATEAANRKEES